MFGDYWYYKLSDAEFEAFRGKIIQEPKQPIHDFKQLTDFILSIQTENTFNDAPMYEFHLVEDFQPGKSLIIFKFHHAFTDGLGMATFMQALGGNYKATNLPCIRPVSKFQQILQYLIAPWLLN